jgi:hypothetical protein
VAAQRQEIWFVITQNYYDPSDMNPDDDNLFRRFSAGSLAVWYVIVQLQCDDLGYPVGSRRISHHGRILVRASVVFCVYRGRLPKVPLLWNTIAVAMASPAPPPEQHRYANNPVHGYRHTVLKLMFDDGDWTYADIGAGVFGKARRTYFFKHDDDYVIDPSEEKYYSHDAAAHHLYMANRQSEEANLQSS